MNNTFDQDLSSWDVGNVNNMNQMFQGAIAFTNVSFGNAPIAIWGWASTGTKSNEGMLCTPKIAANSCCSSVFIL